MAECREVGCGNFEAHRDPDHSVRALTGSQEFHVEKMKCSGVEGGTDRDLIYLGTTWIVRVLQLIKLQRSSDQLTMIR